MAAPLGLPASPNTNRVWLRRTSRTCAKHRFFISERRNCSSRKVVSPSASLRIPLDRKMSREKSRDKEGGREATFRVELLPRLDSNQDTEIQNLMSYRLDDRAKLQ